MNPKFTYTALLLYALTYAGLFTTWAVFVYYRVVGADALVEFIKQALTGLTAHIFTLVQMGDTPQLPGPQP